MPSILSRTVKHPAQAVTTPPALLAPRPPLPSASPLLSTTLRTPLPNLVTPSPDNLRQYYAGGSIPQYRFIPPPPVSANQHTKPASTSTTMSGVLVTTAHTSDTVNIIGTTANSKAQITATNSVAAAMTGVYVSSVAAGSVTIAHPSTAGGTFNIIVTS